ncbi:hypothetical protein [Ferrimonas sp. YFM]|uniref:hypothetical protein n=1 Tax=Ferrimonas sp. YFM TaxID=3028878 RepID=UPI0025748B58|nr:hypothetical protein [Ferrimonas sp. YFM]BDY03667.1 hypothetical protein F0521_07080 [Ferrimonas sp. YFM]
MRSLILSLVLALPLTLQAGEANELAQEMTDRLTEALSLTDSQQAEVLEQQTHFSDTLLSLKESSGSRRDKGRQMRDAAEARDVAMREILTETQWQEYEVIRDEQKQKMREQMKQRRNH